MAAAKPALACANPAATAEQRAPRAPTARCHPQALRRTAPPGAAHQQPRRRPPPRRRHMALATRAGAAASPDVAADISALNQQFGIPGRVEVVAGLGGLPTVVLKHACGASAEVALYGGCITSWKQASGDEVLYMRPDSLKALAGPEPKAKPISGGIPHCFPQARLLFCFLSCTQRLSVHRLLVLCFLLCCGGRATVCVCVCSGHAAAANTGDAPFEFTAALHSYIEVADVGEARVRGLQGLEYLDKTADPANPVRKREEREEVTFEGPVDSVYLKARDYVELDVGTGAGGTVTTNRWDDVVVWAPWTAMPEFYRSLESAQFSSPVRLKPGEHWRSQAEWAVKDL
ncbi:hypothetical protein CHLNCDRAFT_36917 [Chlorella variabilis]|uniref:Glucose-6-phosphate 1-epimerase n=1 Tax=Chlorella variabilis TaxID=554065 RepID=E1ZPL1_CHLVA|nr:hypothetical protein CHLNCDRAFT_36917 [Chlorella variabilis]EFN52258.1 hypothetical protein CHLNCDRAFT_36917 [Chlorella variabilis]|eukprot:XP_005844360.1 hypothetical protein CHLNCDRAFT_36917 [Chlorella variabilis]